MKSISQFLLTLLVSLTFVACGGGKEIKTFGQDPLAGYPESVRNGLPPETRPEKPSLDGICKDCYLIIVNGDEPVMVQETKEMRVAIEVVIFKRQIPVEITGYELQLLNAAEFPGAKLTLEKEIPLNDPQSLTAEKKYVMSWIPPKGTITTETQVRRIADLKLNVSGSVSTTTSKSFGIDVAKLFTVPEIRNVSAGITSINEGSSYRLTVNVFDPDSTSSVPPVLRFVQTASGVSGVDAAQFFKVGVPTYNPSTQIFTFGVDFDLRNKELTTSKEWFDFEVLAINRFQRVSTSYGLSYYVSTVLKDPITSLQPTVYEVTRGQLTIHSFTVMDPGNEGDVTAVFGTPLNNFPGTVLLDCRQPNVANRWLRTCELRASTYASAYLQNFSVRVDTTNKSITGTVPTKIISTNITLKIVDPKPVVTTSDEPLVTEPTSEGGAL